MSPNPRSKPKGAAFKRNRAPRDAASLSSSSNSTSCSVSVRQWRRRGVHLRTGWQRIGARSLEDLALPLGMPFAAKEEMEKMGPDTDTSSDPVTQFFHGENRGRVRGFRHGVTPLASKCTSIQSLCERFRVEMEADRIRHNKWEAEMRSQIKSLFEMIQTFRGSSSHPGFSSQSRPFVEPSTSIPSETIASGYTGLVPATHQPTLHGAPCFLLDFDSTERHVVAMVRLIETDPMARNSRNERLSRICCLVEVINVQVLNYEIPFSEEYTRELLDTKGKIIKWYRSHVEIVKDD